MPPEFAHASIPSQPERAHRHPGRPHHNLKNVDLTLPTGKLIVVTGVSGSGKSSLAFDTIYAEGQRRYVESLSAYARQFLERMRKPDADEIDGICPAIAIRQKNSLRNPRSTVGTTTEIHDYLRLLFARAGRTVCRQCGNEVVRESAEAAARQLLALPAGTRLLLGFEFPVVARPTGTSPSPISRTPSCPHERARPPGPRPGRRPRSRPPSRRCGRTGSVVSSSRAGRSALRMSIPARWRTAPSLQVVVDRLQVGPDLLGRVTDSVETAYLEGGGSAFAIEVGDCPPDTPVVHRFSERFECRQCGIAYEVPQPRLFSFNSPFGACPTCHGFGNVIELDLNLAVPDQSKSIQQNAIEPWTKPHYRSHLVDLKRAARSSGSADDALARPDRRRAGVHRRGGRRRLQGDQGVLPLAGTQEIQGPRACVPQPVSRVSDLPRVRRHAAAPRGPRRLCRGQTIDTICGLTVGAAAGFFDSLTLNERDQAVADRVVREITRRLSFLRDVGLEYLTIDRLSSTLSGGEAQRINLAAALGSALVGTLYVLDEPSIGLHPRDNERLIAILRQLRDQGNTVLVVEHDADTIRVADMVVDLGIGAGDQGGRIVHAVRSPPWSKTRSR